MGGGASSSGNRWRGVGLLMEVAQWVPLQRFYLGTFSCQLIAGGLSRRLRSSVCTLNCGAGEYRWVVSGWY